MCGYGACGSKSAPPGGTTLWCRRVVEIGIRAAWVLCFGDTVPLAVVLVALALFLATAALATSLPAPALLPAPVVLLRVPVVAAVALE
eukprot:9075480-Alexandrium_andersonii.AAC.1